MRAVCSCLLSNDFDVGLNQDISLAGMYRWKVSAYAPCSSTCTTGKLCDFIALFLKLPTTT